MNYLVSSVTVPANDTKRIDTAEGIPIQIWCETAAAFKVYGRYDDTVNRELILDAPSPTAFAPLSLMGGTVKPAHRFIEIDNLSATNANVFHLLVSYEGDKVQAVFGGGGGGGGLSGSGVANQISVWSGASSLTGFSSLTFDGTSNILKIDGQLGLNLGVNSPTSYVDINGVTGYNQLRLRTQFTPTGGGDSSGNVGDFAWDDNKLYLKTTAGWKEIVLANFGAGGGVSGSGAANQLAIWSGATSLTGNNALKFTTTTVQRNLILADTIANGASVLTVGNNATDANTSARITVYNNPGQVELLAESNTGTGNVIFSGNRNKIYSTRVGKPASEIEINSFLRVSQEQQIGVKVRDRLVVAPALDTSTIGNPPGIETGVLETLGPNSSVQIWRRDLSAYPASLQEGHRAILYHTNEGTNSEFRLFTDSVGNIFSFRVNTNPQPWLRFRGRVSFGNNVYISTIGTPSNTDGGIIDVFHTSPSEKPTIALYPPGATPGNGEGGDVFKLQNGTFASYFNAQGMFTYSIGLSFLVNNTVSKLFLGCYTAPEAHIGQFVSWTVRYGMSVNQQNTVHNTSSKPAILTAISKEDNAAACFLLQGTTTVTIIWDTSSGTVFSTTLGTSNRINIGWDGTQFLIENKMSDSRTVYIEKKTLPDSY
jgi:hypothetical protein